MSEYPHLLEPAMGRLDPGPATVTEYEGGLLARAGGRWFRVDHEEGRKLYEALKKVYNDPWK
jgi:hypothetical protein